MERLIDYLQNNNIPHRRMSSSVVEIDGELHQYIEPTDGVLIDKNFSLIVEDPDDECNYYVFCFGGKWYRSLTSTVKVSLTPLKYIGEAVEVTPTKVFLGVRGGFEILNGSGQYDKWCKKAKFLGVKYLGICEKNTLAGIVKFQNACKSSDIIPVLGATYTVKRFNPEVTYDVKVYASNEQGWNNILMMNKEVNVVNNGYIAEVKLLKLLDGVLVVHDPKSLEHENLFPWDLKNYYYQLDTVEFEDEDIDKNYLDNLKKFTEDPKGIPLPITDAFYLDKEDSYIKNLLNQISSIQHNKTVNQYFKSKDDYLSELSLFYKDDSRFISIIDKLLTNEETFVKQISFEIKTGERHLPKYIMTPEEAAVYETTEDLFWGLIGEGLSKLSEDKLPSYMERVEREVKVIEFGKVMDYFLMLHDIIQWCNHNDIIVGIGRGSAGGSLVSMLLGLIHLDPIEFDLLFERFINEGRIVKTLPDIDTDIEGLRRGDVKKYMERRFGVTQVISMGTYTALQLKASIKDLGRIYGLKFEDVNYITGLIEEHTDWQSFIELAVKDKRVNTFVKENTEMINSIQLIVGQPKAKSVHACAMVIFPSEKDMFSWAPVIKQDDLFVSEWEGAEMEQVGFLKEDILGVKQLDKFRNIKNIIKEQTGKDIDIYHIPYDDQAVYKYFRKGYNGDVFHFGSPGLTKYCKELLPEDIEDLVAGISLYRPGAIENNFHNEYVLRKNEGREFKYFTGTENILDKTYGVFVYQEQIMKLAQVLGGLSMVEADDVRKAMVKKKYQELTKYKDRFLPYYVENFGVTEKYAQDVWDQIDKASTYLFNRSHAAAYAITGYICQWFKVHYPIPYWTTAFEMMSQEDIKKGKIAKYLSEINSTGSIKISPIDINESKGMMTADKETIYWGISSIKGLGDVALQQLSEDRGKNGRYFSFEEFLSRHTFKGSKLNKSHIESLILSGAFDKIEKIDFAYKRYDLIKKFREIRKIKTEPDDIFLKAQEDKTIFSEYWWNILQKKISGIAFFDYKDMCDQFIVDDYKYLPQEDYQNKDLIDKRYYATGGYITEVYEREAKQKGKYCSLVIESNYEFLRVTIFPDMYKKITESGIDLIGSEGKILLCTGRLIFDDYHKENMLKIWDESELQIL